VRRPSPALLALAVALTYGAACHGNGAPADVPSSPQQAPASREIQLAPGETARVDGLTVKFDGVSDDSRCPLGVQCFWEGDAVVMVAVSAPAQAGGNLELHTAGRYPREGTYGRYKIELTALVPQPKEGEPVPAADYRATLRVTAP
jgi:hypothetical protein